MQGVCDLLSVACQKQDNFTAGLGGLPYGAVNAMLGAFTYLGNLGLRIWNEFGMHLQPVSKAGHMTLGSNALHNLHILTGVQFSFQVSLHAWRFFDVPIH